MPKLNIEKRKACWASMETSKGWKLGLVIGEKPTHWLRPAVYFADHKQIPKALKKGIVFVEMEKPLTKKK